MSLTNGMATALMSLSISGILIIIVLTIGYFILKNAIKNGVAEGLMKYQVLKEEAIREAEEEEED